MATLTATVKVTNAPFVILVLDWSDTPAVTTATITRYRVDGTATVVRGADALPLTGGVMVVYDSEAPLDEPMTWRATSPQTGTVLTAGPAIVASAGAWWLRHPLKPALSQRLTRVQAIGSLARAAADGVLYVDGRADPIVLGAPRRTPTTTVVFQTETVVQEAAIDALLDDGGILLLQSPPSDRWGSRYIRVDTSDDAPFAPKLGDDPQRRWTLPVTVVGSPAGTAQGPVGYRWQDVYQRFTSWQSVKDTYATWRALMEQGT